jgi:hypothetical protein
MDAQGPAFQVGDQILIVEREYEGELGTIIAISDNGQRYLVVLENGTKMVFAAESLSPRA